MHLAAPLLGYALFVGAAVVVLRPGGTAEVGWDLQAGYLLAPIITAATLMLAGNLLSWLGRGRGLRWLLRATGSGRSTSHRDVFKRRIAVKLARRLVVAAALATALYGVLFRTSELVPALFAQLGQQPIDAVARYLPTADAMALWAAITVGAIAAVRASSSVLGAARYAFPVPYFRLIMLATLFFVLHETGVVQVQTGMVVSGLLPLVAAGVALQYVASGTASLLYEVEERYEKSSRWPAVSGGLSMASAVLSVCGWSAFIWAGLESVGIAVGAGTTNGAIDPRGNFAGALNILYDARVSIFVAAVAGLTLRKLVSEHLESRARHIIPLATIVLVGAMAGGALYLGRQFEEFGVGYPTIGTTVAAGLLGVATSKIARYSVPFLSRDTKDAAAWWGESGGRAFAVGAGMALYGMVVRPALLEAVRFAVVYEWAFICGIAASLLIKSARSKRMAIDETASVETSTGSVSRWTHHRQHLAELPDAYAIELEESLRDSMQSGEWFLPWTYLVPLLIENRIDPRTAAQAMEPIIEHVDPPIGILGLLRPARARRRIARAREAALAEAVRRTDMAIRVRTSQHPETTAALLRSIAEPFIDGQRPTALAIGLAAADHAAGMHGPTAAALWHWLLDYEDPRSLLDAVPWRKAFVDNRRRAEREELAGELIEKALEPGYPRSEHLAFTAIRGFTAQVWDADGKRVAKIPGGTVVRVLSSGDGPDGLLNVSVGGRTEGWVPRSHLRPLAMTLPGDRYGDRRDRQRS